MKSYHKRLSITVLIHLLFALTFNAMAAKLFTPFDFPSADFSQEVTEHKVKSLAYFLFLFHA